MATYKVLAGLNYPDGKGGAKRAEVGAEVDDIPTQSIPWLLADGHIEEVKPVGKSSGKPAATPAPVEEVT